MTLTPAERQLAVLVGEIVAGQLRPHLHAAMDKAAIGALEGLLVVIDRHPEWSVADLHQYIRMTIARFQAATTQPTETTT